MNNIDELERLAKAAMPVLWQYRSKHYPEDWEVSYGEPIHVSDRDYEKRSLSAIDPAAMLALITEVRALREDKARLDYLDRMNAQLNKFYGTTYQWRVILSPNIIRLTAGRQWAGYVGDIDLNDAQCGEGSFDSCRKAIDDARGDK
jgi:hypothetical protein